MPGAYYNENDPIAAQWLRNLIARNLIAPGDVDDRSIVDVRADDLRGYTQCHFFAGVGVWSYALRLAGWPDTRPVWTGSCPCQPFSEAGSKGGLDDERHLWPHWFGLALEQRPECLLGEQVASADGLAWLDFVCADLEAAGYRVGALDTCAAGVGAPHIRQRLFFVADDRKLLGDESQHDERRAHGHHEPIARGAAGVLGDTAGGRRSGRHRAGESEQGPGARRPVGGFWSDAEWIPCRDGKSRPVEPGTFPLAHGAPARVGRLRAYGNAIVAPVAAEFIRAYLDVRRAA